MTAQVHPTAILQPGARLAGDVTVGPYSVIGPQVEVGEGTWIGAHVVLDGRTRIGRDNRIFHLASIGAPPQDKKYAGEDTAVEIGSGNTIREYVTINRGTAQDAGVTRLGSDNWIMAYVHLAHDCQVGSHTIFANLAQLAGHVVIRDWVILGGGTLVHQFVHVGAHAFTGMSTYLDRDLPPFVKAAGHMAKPFGINSEGLRRRGFAAATIAALKQAYRTVYRAGLSQQEILRELARQAAGVTRRASGNWIMAYVPLAHDCQVGSHTVFANLAQLAGHVVIGDWAILGGGTLVHQFVHVGAHSFTGMSTYLDRDLPPFVKAAGHMAKPFGINSEGLRRRGFAAATIAALKQAYRTVYRSGLSQQEILRELEAQGLQCAEVRAIAEFIATSPRGIIR